MHRSDGTQRIPRRSCRPLRRERRLRRPSVLSNERAPTRGDEYRDLLTLPFGGSPSRSDRDWPPRAPGRQSLESRTPSAKGCYGTWLNPRTISRRDLPESGIATQRVERLGNTHLRIYLRGVLRRSRFRKNLAFLLR